MQFVADTDNAGGLGSGAVVALAGATAKTVLNLIASTTITAQLIELAVSFDGTTPTNTPVLVQLLKSTQAGAGTGTAVTMIQSRNLGNTSGGGAAAALTATAAYSAEPTVFSPLKSWLVSPTSGLLVQFPLGREPEVPLTAANAFGLAIRCNAPQAVNVRAYMEFVQGSS